MYMYVYIHIITYICICIYNMQLISKCHLQNSGAETWRQQMVLLYNPSTPEDSTCQSTKKNQIQSPSQRQLQNYFSCQYVPIFFHQNPSGTLAHPRDLLINRPCLVGIFDVTRHASRHSTTSQNGISALVGDRNMETICHGT